MIKGGEKICFKKKIKKIKYQSWILRIKRLRPN